MAPAYRLCRDHNIPVAYQTANHALGHGDALNPAEGDLNARLREYALLDDHTLVGDGHLGGGSAQNSNSRKDHNDYQHDEAHAAS